MTDNQKWPVDESRIDIIGANGNDGIHYELESDNYNNELEKIKGEKDGDNSES